MAGETITLKPTDGDELAIDGEILRLGMEVDWGEQTISPSLATGPDVVGGVVGTRTREVRAAELPIQVTTDTTEEYLAAVNSLNDAAALFALNGGAVSRQVEFEDLDASEELEATVLGCDLDWDEGWMQAHKTFGTATLHLTLQPYWLAEEEVIATTGASTANLVELPVDAPRGNLPAPARLVLTDNASTARRFVEIGGQFYEDVDGTYEWNASDFTLTGTSGSSGSDTDALDGNAISVTGLVGVWQTMALLEGLTLTGSYRARIRALGGSDNASAVFRVVWRPENGSWEEIGSVTANVTDYWDFDIGPLRNYTGTGTIDVRVDVRGTDLDASSNPKLDTLTLLPAELYAVVRGVPVEGIVSGVSIYDDWQHNDGAALGGTVAPVAPATFGTWAESGDPDYDFTVNVSNTLVQRIPAVADSSVTAGQFQTLGATTITDCTVTAAEITVANYSTNSTKETRGGVVARYVDANNWLMLVARKKRQTHGYLNEVALYKNVASSVTKLATLSVGAFAGGSGGPWTYFDLSLTVTAAGVVTISSTDMGTKVLAADSDLAGGALKDGKVGIYAAADHANGFVNIGPFAATANAPTTTNVDVVREGGLGEITNEGAWSEDSDGTNPTPVSIAQGSPRLWIPPIDGRLLVKVRESDSDAEPDVGAGEEMSVSLYERPAFSTLSDALVEPPLPPWPYSLFPSTSLYPATSLYLDGPP